MAEIAAPAAAARAAAEQDEERRRRAPPGKDATPEERARYELERKKVAKYKEDKLKARRDHTRMILESHAQAKRRQLLGKQSEFLANLAFRNSLPDLPFDTKFLQYPHERERLIKYKPNSLEMDYAYEVHEDATLGLMIDLIDPAKYEVPEKPEPLEVGDEQALMMKEEKTKGGRSKARPAVSWLRRTEYMGTDLYDAVHKFKSEVEIQSALREGTENALAEIVAQTLEDRAEASFRDINDPKTLVHPFNKKLKAAKVWDVLPDQLLAANKYAILSYDILPSSDIKSKSIKERETRAILTGITTKKRVGDITNGSILLPNSGADDENSHDAEKFSYYRDYQLNTENLDGNQTKDDAQHCVFIFNPEANEFTYSELMYRVQLKKTKLDEDEKRRRGAIVRRREFSEGEKERRTLINFAYGGVYDEALDDDEHTKEHKRRRTGSKRNDSKATTTDESAESAEDEAKSGTPPPSPPAKKSDKADDDGGDSPAISAASSDSDSD